jgi:hypothetical protein
MDVNPPAGSRISVVSGGGGPVLVIPAPPGSSRYFMGLFLLFWLGLWAIGFNAAASQLWSGKGNAFLVFWLGAWTLGGLFAIASAYRSLRSPVPETIELKRSSIAYDSGVPPLQWDPWNFSGNRKSPVQAWRSVFPKRIRVDLERRQLQTLRLREFDTGNRLTVDVDSDRIEIAANASEVEREWLARLLTGRYSLLQATGGAETTPASRRR